MGETLFIGLSMASILLLVALGLAITYGAMGIINMAHGELVMVGAYTTVLAQAHLGFHFFLCIPLAFLVTATLGFAIERLVVRRLYGRLLDTILATWGVAIIIQQAVVIQLGFSFFGIDIKGLGRDLQNVTVPEMLIGILKIGGFEIQRYRSFIILFTALLVILIWWIVFRTSFGTQLRAVTRNRAMAACCGINDKKVNTWTFALGSGLAGLAGVMVSGIFTVFPNMGSPFVVDGFLVVVAGGVQSLLGTVASAAILGDLNGFVAVLLNESLGKALVFGVVIIIIILRPQGLFTIRGR
jgi:urea transport system permease protein